MELQIPHRICTEVQKESILRRKKGRSTGDPKATVPVKGRGNHRGRDLPGPRTYPSKHTAQNERFGIYGIPEGEEQSDDILEIWEYEVCIPKPRIGVVATM